jgi:hypothetical protein
MLGQLVRKKYGSMLSPGTAKADVHERESAFKEVLHRCVHETEGVFAKRGDLARSLEVGAHIPV